TIKRTALEADEKMNEDIGDSRNSSSYTQQPLPLTPMMIANHGKLLREIPMVTQPLFVETIRPILTAYTQASSKKDSIQQHQLLVELLSIPALMLNDKRGGLKGVRRLHAGIQRHLQRHTVNRSLLPALDAAVSASSSSSSSPSSSSSFFLSLSSQLLANNSSRASRSQSQKKEEEDRKVARATALCRSGHTSKASQVLSSSSSSVVNLSDPTKFAMLLALHPQRSSRLPLPRPPALL